MRGGIDLPRIKTSSARSAPRFDPRACPLHRCSFVVVAACSLPRRALSSLACLLRIAASSLLIAVLILPSFFLALQSSPFFPFFGVGFFSRQRGVFVFWFCLGFWFFSKAKTTTRGSASFFYQLKFGAIFLFINISKISSQLYKVRTLHPIDLCFCFVRFFQF